MATITGIKGLQQAIKAHKKGTAQGVEIGLKKAGLFLQRESMRIVPVEFGPLRASANTRSTGSGHDTEVFVGYGTEYAIYVHEDLEARHKPGKQAKFLEAPYRDHRLRLVEIVGNEVRRRS